MKTALIALILGAIAALGQAPLGWWLAPMIALGLALRGVAALSDRAVGWAAFAMGTGYGAATMPWIVEPFFVEAEIYGWMAPFALIGIGQGMGAFWGVFVRLSLALLRHRVAAAVLGLWASEFARSYLFTGFPWALLGHSFIDTPIAQSAQIIGPLGLSGLMLGLVWLESLPNGAGRISRHAGLLGGLASGLILALIWALGAHLLARPMPADRAMSVRIIQPNATQALKWHPDYARAFFDRHLALSALPLGIGAQINPQTGPLTATGLRPDLILWPETAVPFWLDDAGAGLVMSAQAAGAPLILGLQRAEGSRYFNTLALLDARATPREVYDKHHLVPFGEYIPYGDFLANFGITAFAAQAGNGYSAGLPPRLLDLGPLGRALPLICYEAIFPQDLRATERPDWLLQITNDAWFGAKIGPQQHLAQTRLRAIELGLPLLRSANTGISAVIDARGRVRAELPMNEQGLIDTALPSPLPETLYAKTGDLPALLLLALATLFLRKRQFH